MKHRTPGPLALLVVLSVLLSVTLAGCGASGKTPDAESGAPPPAQVETRGRPQRVQGRPSREVHG